ncbi:MAG: GNAT family N-acetyltransferase [Gaiellaceae bacterium]
MTTSQQPRIVRLEPGDEQLVRAGADLFDAEPTEVWSARFLASEGHHLLFALAAGRPVGFVSGVETTHPDKGTEMFLYELAVDAPARRRGIGRALVEALAALARERGCHGMFVFADEDNVAALATYRRAGAHEASRPVMLEWDFRGADLHDDRPKP